MSEERIVCIHIDAVTQTQMKEIVGHDEWIKAIGYLSTWNMTFPKVDIYADGETDMIAVYLNDEGVKSYSIGAVWHGDHYGFHS